MVPGRQGVSGDAAGLAEAVRVEFQRQGLDAAMGLGQPVHAAGEETVNMKQPSKREDREHLKAGYALLREALDELDQVFMKDSILAHAVRVLGAIEDTLYQEVTAGKVG